MWYRLFQKLEELKQSPDKSAFMATVMSYHRTYYKWGGDDPSGFDCSGLVVEGLKTIGELKEKEDLSASGIWNKYRFRETENPKAGALVFYFNDSGKCYHIAICLDDKYCLTADGGGSTILTEKDAIDANAFIKIRKIDKRNSIRKFVYFFNS